MSDGLGEALALPRSKLVEQSHIGGGWLKGQWWGWKPRCPPHIASIILWRLYPGLLSAW